MVKVDIKKKLQNFTLDVDFEIKKGEFISIAGKSGSGKTTLLRILSGLSEAKGKIKLQNECWLDEKVFLPPQKRKIGFVFQDYALFENLNVEQNLLFVKKDYSLCKRLLEMSDLNELKKRKPNTLSGGQKQRVAICRALMNSPKLLLLDEPLSALDSELRVKLQDELLLFHKEFGLTTILVSHDLSEIYKLSNRVLVLEGGKIIKDGSPKDVLLKTKGSQKFSFDGKILDLKKNDVIFIATICIGQQLSQIVLSEHEAKGLKIGDKVSISTKAFSPILS